MDEGAKEPLPSSASGLYGPRRGKKSSAEGKRDSSSRRSRLLDGTSPSPPGSNIGRSTILAWARAYEKGRRLESLYPEERKDKGRSRVMDEEAIAALVSLKKDRMGVSLPVLLKEARAEGILPPRYMVSYATIYRISRNTESPRRTTSIPTGGSSRPSCRTTSGSRIVCTAPKRFAKGG